MTTIIDTSAVALPQEEIWKPVADSPGCEVSNQGRVRSYWKQRGLAPPIIGDRPRLLRPAIGNNGYCKVCIGQKGSRD